MVVVTTYFGSPRTLLRKRSSEEILTVRLFPPPTPRIVVLSLSTQLTVNVQTGAAGNSLTA